MPQLAVENADPKELERFYRNKLEAEIDTITVGRMIEKGETDFTLVDVRDAETFEQGHVKGAINVPLEDLSSKMGELDQAKPVLVYCYNHECLMSAKAARVLSSKGFKVQDVIGGFERFEANGAPIEQGTVPVTPTTGGPS